MEDMRFHLLEIKLNKTHSYIVAKSSTQNEGFLKFDAMVINSFISLKERNMKML